MYNYKFIDVIRINFKLTAVETVEKANKKKIKLRLFYELITELYNINYIYIIFQCL